MADSVKGRRKRESIGDIIKKADGILNASKTKQTGEIVPNSGESINDPGQQMKRINSLAGQIAAMGDTDEADRIRKRAFRRFNFKDPDTGKSSRPKRGQKK